MIWEHAGILGLHPDPFTLRELVAMSNARRVENWEHTSRLLTAAYNPWLKKPITDPDLVNPLAHLKRPWQRRKRKPEKKLTPKQSFNVFARGMVK